MKNTRRIQPGSNLFTFRFTSVHQLFLIAACLGILNYPIFAHAECTWPGKDNIPPEPPVLVPPPGSTVTCTGVETGVFVSDVPFITVEVDEGASIGGVELLGESTTVINYGAVRDDGDFEGFGVQQGESSTFVNYGEVSPGVGFFGSGYTATNYGLITSSLTTGGEFSPTGAMFSGQTGNGTMTNAASIEGVGIIQTSGDYAAGILLHDPTGINNIDNQAYLPEEGPLARASITTTGFGSPGIYVIDDLSTGEVNIDNDGLIETWGGESAGISVYPVGGEIPFSNIARITNDGYGSIVTNGVDSQGILAYAGDVEVTNIGGILTREWNSAGIDAIGLTSIRVWNKYGVPITTEGTTFSPGIAILGGKPSDYTYSVLNEGHINTIGADSPGIVVFGGQHTIGNVCFAEEGCLSTITTAGDGSSGIQLGVVEPGLDINQPSKEGSVHNAGTITTDGAFAAGIKANGRENVLENKNGGVIITNGEASPGVEVVYNDPASTWEARNKVYNHGNIVTYGNSSSGIFADGQRSTVINYNSIITGGVHSYGLKVDGQYSASDNRGSIITSGERAYGMNLNMRNGAAYNSGSIETIGMNAYGILYAASYLDPLNNISNSGTIATDGGEAHGIYALYSTYSINNTGGISTTGDAAHGIRTNSTDVFATLVPPTEIKNSGEIFVSGAGSIGLSIERKLLEETNIENTIGGRITSNGVAIAGSEGYENVTNRGLINGDIVLGGAKDTFINDGIINGNVALGGSGDEFYRGALSAIDGIVDAGEEDEEFGGDILKLLTVSGNEVVDGSKFINFEKTFVEGVGSMTLSGAHNADLTTINGVTLYVAGRLESEISTLNGGGVKVIDGGLLGGNGTVGADVEFLTGGKGNSGESIGSLTIEGDLFLNGGILEFEADSLFDKDEMFVGGDAIFNEGFIDVFLGFVPAPDDILEFLAVQGTLDILEGFGGIRGIATAGSGVPLGTEFTVALGEEIYQGIVTSAVPVPPSVWLFGSGLLGLVGIARRKRTA
jgi:hypothetical protein